MSDNCWLIICFPWNNLQMSSQAERRRKLGLPPEDPAAVKPSATVVEEKKV